MAKKYTNYTIKITYTNGDTEDITLKGINTSSYKDMLGIYSDIKEEHDKDSCIIEFLGISEKGELGVIFTKEININSNNEDKLKMKTEDIGIEIAKLLEALKLKKEYHSNNIGAYEKKQDFLLHKLQICNDDNELLSIAKDIKEVRSNRMCEKNEILYISQFTGLNDILNRVNISNNNINKIQRGEQFTEENIGNYNIMKEVNYKTDKERIHLVSQLKNKYEKMVIDEINKKITFYNHGYTNKNNKKVV